MDFIQSLLPYRTEKTPEDLVKDCADLLDGILDGKRKVSAAIAEAKAKVSTGEGDGAAAAAAAAAADPSEDQKKLAEDFKKMEDTLKDMKTTLYGEFLKDGKKEQKEPNEDHCKRLMHAVVDTGLMMRLVGNLEHLPFEARKDLAHVFASLVKKGWARGGKKSKSKKSKGGEGGGKGSVDGNKFVEYLQDHPTLIEQLALKFEFNNCEINVAEMLKAMAAKESLARYMLEPPEKSSPVYLRFVNKYCYSTKFEVCTEAFDFLRILLTRRLAPDFLEKHYTEFFQAYSKLLQHEEYIQRRMSLKLLGELLLERQNFKIMMMYISDRINLRTIMYMLAEENEQIQFEAFHVFKVFVANPRKTQEISEVLRMNARKLIPYLRTLQENSDDASFLEEKTLLITELQKLQDQPASEKDKAEAAGAAAQGPAAAKTAPIAEQAKDASVDEQHV